MKATRIAILFKDEDEKKWEELANVYQDMGVDDMIVIAKNRYPDDFISDDDPDFEYYEEEIEGEIQDETPEYILTWEDGMGETMRIYKKIA